MSQNLPMMRRNPTTLFGADEGKSHPKGNYLPMQNSISNICILTFDVEEWYHGAYPGYDYSMVNTDIVRVIPMMEKIIAALTENNAKATFFVLGEIALKHPEIVKMIIDSGNELASHSFHHIRAETLGKEKFENEIIKSKEILENQSGKKIIGFRAPNFSISAERTPWAFDILKKYGFEYDSSIFPAMAYYGGSPRANRYIHELKGLEEYPLSAFEILGFRIAFSGGFYFRVLPKFLIWNGIKSYWRKNFPPIIYLHPKDLDSQNPPLPLGWMNNFAHKGFSKKAFAKFEYFFKKCKFISISDWRKISASK